MSKPKRPQIAICYDFDGTLSPGNMQEYDYIPQLNMTSGKFWNEVRKRAKEQSADQILAYMELMVEKAKADPSKGIEITRHAFEEYGKNVKLYKGVVDWFTRINTYGRDNEISVAHYVISSGIREMILGTPIFKEFARIYASSFMYDQHGVAYWPALALNYTAKTQYLFRINKGVLDVWNDEKINEYIPKEKRPVPFERIIYIGDGTTDVPCMRLVKDQGGHSIAVYKPRTSNERQKALKLLKEERVDFIAQADYRNDKELDKIVKAIIQKIAQDYSLKKMKIAT